MIGLTIMLTKKLWFSGKTVTLKDKSTKYPLKLIEKKILNHDTRIFRFKLPSEQHVLGLPVGQHIYLTARINDSLLIRPYTPISAADASGYMQLLIKVYFKGVHPKFPDGGKMTQYLDSLNIGDSIEVRGPNGLLQYQGNGEFKIQPDKKSPPKTHHYKNLCMIAGGSGITPMYQMILHILREPDDQTKLCLLYANQTEQDILLRESLDDLAVKHKERFKCWYTIDKAKDDWRYSTGFINADMMNKCLAPPSDETIVTMCGPPPMIQFACQPSLDKLGHQAKNRFVF